MATLAAIANGNWSTAATWGVCNAASELDSEVGTATISSVFVDSSAFTPGAITILGIMVKLHSRTSSLGTMWIELRQAGTTVTGTTVLINVADLESVAGGQLGGWQYFKFASPVTLAAATAYTVAAKGTNANVTLYRDATANNYSRQLVTDATGAPAAADKCIIAGELTGAGTGNDRTVTYNSTASTDYGAIKVCKRGILTLATTASTAYILKTSGDMEVYGGGKLWLGTTGTPLPSTSSLDFLFDCTTNVEFGLNVRYGGELIIQGAAKTVKAKVNMATLNAAATSITTDVSTGWKNGDEIAIAPMTRTASEAEKKSLTADASGTTLTIAALTSPHHRVTQTGVNYDAELINLTRNIKIHGVSTSLQSYVNIGSSTAAPVAYSVDIDYVEFYWLGSNTTDKRGVQFQSANNGTNTGSISIQNSVSHDFMVSNSVGFHLNVQTSGVNIDCQNNVVYDVNLHGFFIIASSAVHVINECVAIKVVTGSGFNHQDVGSTFTNNVVAGCVTGLNITEAGAILGTMSGNSVHSCSGDNIVFLLFVGGTASGFTTWRSTISGLNMQIPGRAIIDGVIAFGNLAGNIVMTGGAGRDVRVRNAVVNAGTTLVSASGIRLTGATIGYIFENCSIGTTETHSSGDVLAVNANFFDVVFRDCTFGSTTELAGAMGAGSRVRFERKDGVDGSHITATPEGNISYDTTISDSDGYSERLTPLLTIRKLESGPRIAAVSDGSTITFNAKVRKSATGSGDAASYNGAQPRLILRANAAMGIDADVILDTATSASDGAWEILTGTSAAVQDDGVLEAFVDCDGTTGWVNIDTWTTDGEDSSASKYWYDGLPISGSIPEVVVSSAARAFSFGG